MQSSDVAGAYLNADMDEFTLMKLTAKAADIMVNVNQSYNKFIV
jgi:hypothetical protein